MSKEKETPQWIKDGYALAAAEVTLGERRLYDNLPGVVVDVHDGDTYTVEMPWGGREIVRQLGVDTPETDLHGKRVEKGSEFATREARKQLLGKKIQLSFNPTGPGRDKYGRLLANVIRTQEDRTAHTERQDRLDMAQYMSNPDNYDKNTSAWDNIARGASLAVNRAAHNIAGWHALIGSRDNEDTRLEVVRILQQEAAALAHDDPVERNRGSLGTIAQYLRHPSIMAGGALSSATETGGVLLGSMLGGPVGALAAAYISFQGVDYSNLRIQGSDVDEAMIYSVLQSATKAALVTVTTARLEHLYRGVNSVIGKAITKKTGKQIPKVLAHIIGPMEDFGSEYIEEASEQIIDNAINIFLGHQKGSVFEGAHAAGIEGGAIGIGMGGPKRVQGLTQEARMQLAVHAANQAANLTDIQTQEKIINDVKNKIQKSLLLNKADKAEAIQALDDLAGKLAHTAVETLITDEASRAKDMQGDTDKGAPALLEQQAKQATQDAPQYTGDPGELALLEQQAQEFHHQEESGLYVDEQTGEVDYTGGVQEPQEGPQDAPQSSKDKKGTEVGVEGKDAQNEAQDATETRETDPTEGLLRDDMAALRAVIEQIREGELDPGVARRYVRNKYPNNTTLHNLIEQEIAQAEELPDPEIVDDSAQEEVYPEDFDDEYIRGSERPRQELAPGMREVNREPRLSRHYVSIHTGDTDINAAHQAGMLMATQADTKVYIESYQDAIQQARDTGDTRAVANLEGQLEAFLWGLVDKNRHMWPKSENVFQAELADARAKGDKARVQFLLDEAAFFENIYNLSPSNTMLKVWLEGRWTPTNLRSTAQKHVLDRVDNTRNAFVVSQGDKAYHLKWVETPGKHTQRAKKIQSIEVDPETGEATGHMVPGQAYEITEKGYRRVKRLGDGHWEVDYVTDRVLDDNRVTKSISTGFYDGEYTQGEGRYGVGDRGLSKAYQEQMERAEKKQAEEGENWQPDHRVDLLPKTTLPPVQDTQGNPGSHVEFNTIEEFNAEKAARVPQIPSVLGELVQGHVEGAWSRRAARDESKPIHYTEASTEYLDALLGTLDPTKTSDLDIIDKILSVLQRRDDWDALQSSAKDDPGAGSDLGGAVIYSRERGIGRNRRKVDYRDDAPSDPWDRAVWRHDIQEALRPDYLYELQQQEAINLEERWARERRGKDEGPEGQLPLEIKSNDSFSPEPRTQGRRAQPLPQKPDMRGAMFRKLGTQGRAKLKNVLAAIYAKKYPTHGYKNTKTGDYVPGLHDRIDKVFPKALHPEVNAALHDTALKLEEIRKKEHLIDQPEGVTIYEGDPRTWDQRTWVEQGQDAVQQYEANRTEAQEVTKQDTANRTEAQEVTKQDTQPAEVLGNQEQSQPATPAEAIAKVESQSPTTHEEVKQVIKEAPVLSKQEFPQSANTRSALSNHDFIKSLQDIANRAWGVDKGRINLAKVLNPWYMDVIDGDARVLSHLSKVTVRDVENIIKEAFGLSKYDPRSDAKIYKGRSLQELSLLIQLMMSNRRHADSASFRDQVGPNQQKWFDLALQSEKDPVMKGIVDQIQSLTDLWGNRLVEMGLLTEAEKSHLTVFWDPNAKPIAKNKKFLRTTATLEHARGYRKGGIMEGWAKGDRLMSDTKGFSLDVATIMHKSLSEAITKNQNLQIAKIGLDSGLLSSTMIPGYKKVPIPLPIQTDQGLQMQQFYAAPKVSRQINAILGESKLRQWPVTHTLLKIANFMKQTFLLMSAFHLQTFFRQYVLGTYGIKNTNPVQGIKAGQAAMTAFDADAQALIRAGLTIEMKVDYDPSLGMNPTTLEKTFKGTKLEGAYKKFMAMKTGYENFLFQTVGANLKMQNALVEYQHRLKTQAQAIAEGKTSKEEIARAVASGVNNDFGGLNTHRLGISKTTQDILRMLFLGHDWTLSNTRAAVNAIGTGQEARIHQLMWARVVARGAVGWLLFNMMMAGMDKERDLDDLVGDMWKSGQLAWLNVDITPLHKALGSKDPRTRYFSLLGHFADPANWLNSYYRALTAKDTKRAFFLANQPLRGKSSFLFQSIISLIEGHDFAGREFTTPQELFETGQLAKFVAPWEEGSGAITDPNQLLSWGLYNMSSMVPGPLQELFRTAAGQQNWLDLALKGVGSKTKIDYSKK